MAEVMMMYDNKLRELAEVDLTDIGQQDIDTLNAGISNGFITTQEVMAQLKPLVEEGATVDIKGQGETTMGTLIEGYKAGEVRDRKSTRLNSSHVSISYAVFCL